MDRPGRTALTSLAIAVLLACGAPPTPATGPSPAAVPGATSMGAPAGTSTNPDSAKAKPKIKAFKDLITDRARSDSGLFVVYVQGDSTFFEIPNALLGRDMLLVSRIARTATKIGYGGEETNEGVVRWERQGDKILLRTVSYLNVADDSLPIARAVEAANLTPIIAALPIVAYSGDSTATLIDISKLYTGDIPLFGLDRGRRETYVVRRLDDNRSYLAAARSYPRNIEVRAVLTYEAGKPPSNQETGTITLEMSHSMIILPEHPMQARVWDERVGFFRIDQTDYGRSEQRAVDRRYITRWRMEPRDTAAFLRGELTEPVKPIVYYIDPATPLKWRPYLKQGIEDWNAAFAEAGFKNAIIAKDPPTAEEDPEFSPEDVRYSVIRYFPSDIENAYGPSVVDPRSGEILESDIGWYHNVMNLLRNWYLIQTAAVNPAARSVQFADSTMGELIRFVSSHEVGHTIGLPHNMKASSAYPVDSLRSPSFTRRMNTAPSIMDYARFNYVAQPGDGDVSLHPGIGIYDHWAIRWGYRPIPAATSADGEKRMLDGWILEHAGDSLYRFGDPSQIDPTSQTEDLGDDGVKASTYGIANLKRILPNLSTWSFEPGEDYSQLSELYNQVIGQWARYMGHVTAIVGGVEQTRKAQDQPGPVYTILPRARQVQAVKFLAAQAFATPTWMLNREILSRIEHAGAVDRLRGRQVGVLNNLLEPRRMQRLIESEAAIGKDAYTLADLFADAHAAVWSELTEAGPIDEYRRNLQRGYLERLTFLMTQELPPIPPEFARFITVTNVNVAQSDIRAFARGDLERIKRGAAAAAGRTRDSATRLHLRDVVARVEKILDPKN
ncbi:MAG: zinc-dependent metalloprotease [Gemmatimonadales bacterium]